MAIDSDRRRMIFDQVRTKAMSRLEGKHAIKAERGLILIKDIEKLRELAGPIYGIAEKEYEQHIRQDWRY
ncbi:hypothetical protein MRBLMR1_002207 [Neorhizobium sp. LMR1-1-1.1]